MKLSSVLIIIGVIIVGLTASAFTDPVKKELNLNLQAAGIETLKIDCGAGYLKVRGVEGLNQIEVKATLEVKGIDEDELEEFKKEFVDLSLEKSGSKAVLTSEVKDNFSISSIFKNKSAHINLDVQIPKNLALDVKDGSGSVEIFDMNSDVELEDGSGSITIENINGKLEIEDGSGSIGLNNIGGNVKINDGSGSIDIKDVGGDLNVDDDSGSIDIKDIKGSVVVDDGSGSISIYGVDKDVTIKNAGSGGLSIHNVKGTVKR